MCQRVVLKTKKTAFGKLDFPNVVRRIRLQDGRLACLFGAPFQKLTK